MLLIVSIIVSIETSPLLRILLVIIIENCFYYWLQYQFQLPIVIVIIDLVITTLFQLLLLLWQTPVIIPQTTIVIDTVPLCIITSCIIPHTEPQVLCNWLDKFRFGTPRRTDGQAGRNGLSPHSLFKLTPWQFHYPDIGVYWKDLVGWHWLGVLFPVTPGKLLIDIPVLCPRHLLLQWLNYHFPLLLLPPVI